MDDLDLLLHPVRIRIVHALGGGATLTTSELCARLPDLAQATIYRHVRLLADHELIRVVGERRARGAIERRYRLNAKSARVDEDEARRMSIDDHRRAFAAAMAVLLAEFNGYLNRAGSHPSDDLVGYRQIPVWMSTSELRELIHEVSAAIQRLANNPPADDRRPYLVSPIVFPIAQPGSDG